MPISFQNDRQNKQIAMLRHKEEEESVQRLSQKTNIPYVDLTSITIETDALALIKKDQAEKIEAAGFKLVGKDLYVAIRSPEKPGLREELFRLQNDGYAVGVYLASRRSLEKAWDRYEDISITTKSRSSFLDISPQSLEEVSERSKDNEAISAMIKEAESSDDLKKVTRIIEVILGSSIATGSSDVHIEPKEDVVTIRYRQDGVLQDIANISHTTSSKLNARIKILSKLKLTQESQSQDGRFTINFKNQEIEVRTSIIPGAYGESIVMRILNPDIISIEMKSLGIEPKLFSILREYVHKPNGLILTTGPTGSGKTTTLYAFLKEIYTPEIKILTIEDPIEYHLSGITQTQVNKEKGYTFLSGLRGALRQDPDAIMVGEIRDTETAEIAVNASLTGHIVLSTLHTNNAAGAIPRMLDLGINPKVLPSALTVSIAQRLIRKLVPECREAYKPDADTEKLIRRILKQAEANGKDLASYGVSADQEIILYRPKNGTCPVGNGSGYKGRIGLFEAILLDENIENIITKNPSEREIRRMADKQGILTMQEDGVLKALAGVTSIEEVKKVVDLTELLEDDYHIGEFKKPTIDEIPGFTVNNTHSEENILPPKPIIKDKPLVEDLSMHTTSSQQDQDLHSRIDKLESALHRLVGVLENTQTPSSPTATVHANYLATNENRKSRREYQKQVREIENIIEGQFYPDEVASKIADQVRDLEILTLLEEIESLEQEQIENPTKEIADQIQYIRNKIIKILKTNPPQSPVEIWGEQEGSVMINQIKALLDDLMDTEEEQRVLPSKSAAPRLAQAKKTIDEVLTSPPNK